MAGLLDIFGSTPDIYAGLLGEEGIAQAKRQAQSDALLNLSASLMKAGAPSRTPQGLGLGLVEGMQAAQKGYKESMQGALQEKLTQQKIAEALAAKKRQADVNSLLGQAVTTTPAVYANTPLMDIYGTEVAGPNMPQPAMAKFDLGRVTPQLMATAEGRAALKELAPDYKAVGDYLYQIPLAGTPTQVAGQAKPQRLTGNESNIALRLFGTNDPTQLTADQNAKIGQLAQQARKDAATVVYPPGALAPDKGVAKDLQTGLIGGMNRLSAYNAIEAGFKPEYLQPAFRATQSWNAIREKGGASLDPTQKQSLVDFSKFKQNSVQQLNTAIKEQTGASMGVQEAERIIAGLPNAGTGLFDGDSPTEFEAKLKNSIEQMRKVEARNAYVLRKGLSFKDISLDDVPSLINKRAGELATQYNVDLKNATPQQLKAIKRQLTVEFGITSD